MGEQEKTATAILKKQIRYLDVWNEAVLKQRVAAEDIEQVRRNIKTMLDVCQHINGQEPDIDKIAEKMAGLLAGAQNTYNPIKDTKPASLPKILVDGVACPLPAVVTLSLSEAEEMVHENKDELLARQRNDRKGIEYHLS